MNFLYISPTFPKYYYNFCDALKKKGITVLGIGDTPLEKMNQEMKDSFQEYQYLPSLENYDDLMKATAYFIYKYGRIDFIASNIEYWLESEAKLRDDFNIARGIRGEAIEEVKIKSVMKDLFIKEEIPTAPYEMVTTFRKAKAFAKHHHYPIILKPDNGMGAMHVHKIHNGKELAHFFGEIHDYDYIMEDYVDGIVETYDGLCNSKRDVLFDSSMIFPTPLMDIVNGQKASVSIIQKDVPKDLRQLGQKILRLFPSEGSFFHIECFRLKKDCAGYHKGDLVVSEVNMRLPGGHIPEVMNYIHHVDLYEMYAQMIQDDTTTQKAQRDYYGVNVGRRNNGKYHYKSREIKYKYQDQLVMVEHVPAVLSDALGDTSYVAKFKTMQEVRSFINDCTK